MSGQGHTPGPWINEGGLVTGLESRERYRGMVSVDLFDADEWPVELSEEAHANARLIAAAPDLLEALTGLGVMPDGYCFCVGPDAPRDASKTEHTGECRAARAAIRKATGEPQS